MNMRRLAVLALPLALLLAASSAMAGELSVTYAWARATPPGAAMGVIYLRIDNGSTKSDRLLKLRTSVAASADVHRTEIVDDIARMREVAVLHVAPGEKVEFAPGGLHVMLMGLKKPLVAGKTFEIELVFEVAGPRRVVVSIRD
ncbi:MAG: copper chaperone PCu(A)C [Gammaproteobacteria bacterium]|nr:copper chaperone PCu(A)C [Gammaproteobacteria bacterium]